MSARFINPLQVLNVKGVISPVSPDEVAPLRLTAVGGSDSYVSFSPNNVLTMQYKRSGDEQWNNWDFSQLTIQPGEYIELRCDYNSVNVRIGTFIMSGGDIAASGSIMSLAYGENLNADNNLIIKSNNIFSYLFHNCSNLVSAPDLPAVNMKGFAYEGLFADCPQIDEVKISFTDWDVNSVPVSTNWLAGASLTGTFRCPAALDQSQRNDSHIPAGWTIETF